MDVLPGVLDIAGLAVDAVRGVDLQAHGIALVLGGYELVNTCGAIQGLRAVVKLKVHVHRNRRVPQRQMDRLILFMIGVGKVNRGQPVEGDHPVRFRIFNPRRLVRLPDADARRAAGEDIPYSLSHAARRNNEGALLGEDRIYIQKR